MALDSAGNLFIVDVSNGRIRKVDTLGIITTVAGNGIPTGFFDGEGGDPADDLGDGGPATSASLNGPFGVALDGLGNGFIADTSNQRIRRVDAATGIITTVAGDGFGGSSGDGGPATSARLFHPTGVALDGTGNLFIADLGNHRIRKVDTSGIITTVAGDGFGGFSGYGGPATSASLNLPHGVALDGAGNLFIADQFKHRIRKVDTSGIITTVAGNGSATFPGDGGPATSARLFHPTGVALDGAGNLFIADSSNHRVRKVDTSGIITTVAGNGSFGFSGDGGPATSARLGSPSGVALDSSGNLFIVDLFNDRIRKVGSPNPPAVSLSITDLTFADQGVGTTSTAQTVTLTNTGEDLLTITSIAVSGDFDQTNTCSNPLAVGESCTISVTFTPTLAGTRTGELTVIADSVGVSTVALTGTGGAGGVPAVALSSTTLSFVDQPVGTTSAAQTVTLTNTGDGVLNVTGLTVSGDFAQTNDCAPLAPSASCTVNVSFSPTAGGARTGTLTIDSNDPGSPDTVNLTGTGTEFVVTVTGGGDTVTITAGGTANYELLLAPAGFVGTVTLTCTGVPAGTTCTVTPNMVTLDGTIGVAIMVIVTTTAPSLLMPPAGPQSGMPWLPWLLGLAMTVALAEALRRRSAWAGRLMPQRAWPVLAATLLFAALWASCGSGGPTLPPAGGGIPTGGTPTGTSTLVINASSGGQVVQTINLTLTVN